MSGRLPRVLVVLVAFLALRSVLVRDDLPRACRDHRAVRASADGGRVREASGIVAVVGEASCGTWPPLAPPRPPIGFAIREVSRVDRSA
jgi:hypothetical protein